MVREIRVQSQVDAYQRLRKLYLMLPYLTLSIIRYGSSVKGSNSGNGVVSSLTPRCSSYLKESLRVTLDTGQQFFTFTYAFSMNNALWDISAHSGEHGRQLITGRWQKMKITTNLVCVLDKGRHSDLLYMSKGLINSVFFIHLVVYFCFSSGLVNK